MSTNQKDKKGKEYNIIMPINQGEKNRKRNTALQFSIFKTSFYYRNNLYVCYQTLRERTQSHDGWVALQTERNKSKFQWRGPFLLLARGNQNLHRRINSHSWSYWVSRKTYDFFSTIVSVASHLQYRNTLLNNQISKEPLQNKHIGSLSRVNQKVTIHSYLITILKNNSICTIQIVSSKILGHITNQQIWKTTTIKILFS